MARLLVFFLAALELSPISAQIQWKTTPKVIASSDIDLQCPLQEESRAVISRRDLMVFWKFY